MGRGAQARIEGEGVPDNRELGWRTRLHILWIRLCSQLRLLPFRVMNHTYWPAMFALRWIVAKVLTKRLRRQFAREQDVQWAIGDRAMRLSKHLLGIIIAALLGVLLWRLLGRIW
jgi:hypothetical protein